jgi:hypothetical protein
MSLVDLCKLPRLAGESEQAWVDRNVVFINELRLKDATEHKELKERWGMAGEECDARQHQKELELIRKDQRFGKFLAQRRADCDAISTVVPALFRKAGAETPSEKRAAIKRFAEQFACMAAVIDARDTTSDDSDDDARDNDAANAKALVVEENEWCASLRVRP